MEIEKVAVIGAGIMGHGIAQCFAQNRKNVMMVDIDEKILQKAMERIKFNLETMIEAEYISEDEAKDALSRIECTTDLKNAVEDVDFVVEAVPENMELKKRVFRDLDENAPEHAILATNTSGLSITELSESTDRPEKVIGTHWWNPPPIVPIMEIVLGAHTSEETLQTTVKLHEEMGKAVIVVKKDIPGFVTNRIWAALLREVFALLQEGVASVEDLDLAVRASLGFRLPVIGPIMQADLGGLDTYTTLMDYLFKEIDCSREAHPILKEKVKRGELGIKTGKGFYNWDKNIIDSVIRDRDKKFIEILKVVQPSLRRGGK